MLLFILDVFLTLTHIVVTAFNVTGWIWRPLRRLHRWCVALTAVSWLIIGSAIGTLGYCFLTDWHWQVKRLRGETDLPHSFISYLFAHIGIHSPPLAVDIAVAAVFAAVCLITIGLYVRERILIRKKTAR
jgi:hypothetical protein